MRTHLLYLAALLLGQTSAFAVEPNTNAVASDARFKRVLEIHKQLPNAYTTMLKAANEYASVRAKEKEVASTGVRRKGVLWNSVGISGGLNKSTSENTAESSAPGPQPDVNSRSLSASLSIALTTWFARQGIALTEELQRNALKALKMQLAIEAGSAHFGYLKSTEQYFLLRSIANGLERIKTCASKGEILLTPENIALLEIQITSAQFKLEAIDAQTSMARSSLKRLTGSAYPDIIKEYRKLFEEVRIQEDANPCKWDEKNRMKAKWDGIPWDKIEATFPIPATAEQAIGIARTSPALVMADLGTDLARNQWHLGIAGMAPVLSFTFTRSKTDIGAPPSAILSNGDSFIVSLGFRISAGVPFELRSAKLLEEAARLNYRAAEFQVRNGLENSYDGLRSSRSSIQLVEQALRTSTFPALNNIGPVTDENIRGMLGLFEAAVAQIDMLSSGFSGYVLQKAGILAQTGTLMADLPGLEQKSKAKPQ